MITDEKVLQLVAWELKVPVELLQPDVALSSLPGYDSVQLLMLMVALEEAGVKIPSTQAANLRTMQDILALERR